MYKLFDAGDYFQLVCQRAIIVYGEISCVRVRRPVGIWPAHVFELFDNAVRLYLLCCKYMHVQVTGGFFCMLNAVSSTGARYVGLVWTTAPGCCTSPFLIPSSDDKI